jgi:hypothetical protein
MIRNKRLLTYALALTAGAALAQPPEGKGPPPGKDGAKGPKQGERRPAPPLVAALDTDKDGTISAAEIDNAPESLKTLDKNHDGKITMEELRPPRPEGDGQKGPGDKNQRGPGGDGQGGKGGPRDGGGERKGPRDGGKGPGQDGGAAGKQGDAPDGQGGPQGGRQGGGKRPVPPLISVLDADGDGVISADEIAGAAVSLRKLDKNGDGQLTPEEYRPEPPKRDGEQGNRTKGPRDGDGPKPQGKDGENNNADGDAKKRPAAE